MHGDHRTSYEEPGVRDEILDLLAVVFPFFFRGPYPPEGEPFELPVTARC